MRELQLHALQLELLGLRYIRNEPNKTECLLFGLGESGRLVERWIVKQFDSALGSASHLDYLSFVFFFKSGPVILYLSYLGCSGRHVGFDHFFRVDNAIEFGLGHKAELQRGCLQRQVVVHCVVRDL